MASWGDRSPADVEHLNVVEEVFEHLRQVVVQTETFRVHWHVEWLAVLQRLKFVVRGLWLLRWRWDDDNFGIEVSHWPRFWS